MDQPLFRRNPETNEVEEYQPVKVTRDELAKDLDAAQNDKTNADGVVSELEVKAKEVNEALDQAYKVQEAAAERVAFRQTRLASYDAVSTDDNAPIDGAPGSAVEDAGPAGADAGAADSEDVADSDGDDAATDEPQDSAPQEVEISIRRRATVA